MNFLHYKVSTNRGDVLQVILSGHAANVFVMNDVNFQNYRSGAQFQYYGGYYTQSPVHIRLPAGAWNVVVDLGGYPGSVNAAVRVLHA